MRRVWKYELELIDEQVLNIPGMPGTSLKERILCVDSQNGKPCLWVMVDDKETAFSCTIHMRGTGHPCGDDLGNRFEPHQYIGTIKLAGDNLILHLFLN